jgi:hypothetical protein
VRFLVDSALSPFVAEGLLGQYIANHSSLSQKNYGYARWSDLIRATGYFDEISGDNHQPSFRNKKTGKTAEAS